jgi:hypothetical protein
LEIDVEVVEPIVVGFDVPSIPRYIVTDLLNGLLIVADIVCTFPSICHVIPSAGDIDVILGSGYVAHFCSLDSEDSVLSFLLHLILIEYVAPALKLFIVKLPFVFEILDSPFVQLPPLALY